MLARPLHRPFTPPRQAQGGAAANAGGGGGNPAAGMWWEGMDLWLDFANNYGQNAGAPTTPTALVTDTHAQTIYEPDTTGLYLPFSANVLTRTDLGLQTVPTRTNLVRWSQQFNNAAWTKTAVTIAADAISAPDGTTTADKLEETSATSAHNAAGSATVSAATVYTISVFLKQGERRYAAVYEGGGGGGKFFDLQAGTVGGNLVTPPTSAAIVAVGNGWYLCSITFTSIGTIVVPSVYLSTDGTTFSYAGTTGFGVYAWNMQLEAGAFATPPITTTSAAVTVNGNQQVISLPTQLAVGVAGVVQVNVLGAFVSGALPRIFEISDGTPSNSINMYLASTTDLQMDMRAGGGLQGSVTQAVPNTGLMTIAFAASLNFIQWRMVGQAANTVDVIATFPSGLIQAALAGRGYSTDRNNYGYTRKLALKFGPQNAGTFAQMYALAQIAAAS